MAPRGAVPSEGVTPSADVSVRAARAAEAEAVAAVQVAAWTERYARLLPAGVLAGLDPAAVAAQWRAAVERPPTPRHVLLVALEGAAVRGFAAIGPATDEDARGSGELLTLLVLPGAERRGHGSRLLQAAAAHWRDLGWAEAVAWVLDGDTVLRDFLLAAGWGSDGATRGLDTGEREVGQVRLHTDLREEG